MREPVLVLPVARELWRLGREEKAKHLLGSANSQPAGIDDLSIAAVDLALELKDVHARDILAEMARSAKESSDPKARIRGLMLEAKLQESAGGASALMSYQHAWEIAGTIDAHAEQFEAASKAARAALDVNDLGRARLWLTRMRPLCDEHTNLELRAVEAGIAGLSGNLAEAETHLSAVITECRRRGLPSRQLEAETNLAAVRIARGELFGDVGRGVVADLQSRCEALKATEWVAFCVRLMAELYRGEGEMAKALEVLEELGGNGGQHSGHNLRFQLLEIEAEEDQRAKLTKALLLIEALEAPGQGSQHLVRAYLIAGKLLLQRVEPSSEAAAILEQITPPLPGFSAAFECARRAENIARSTAYGPELLEATWLMIFAVGATHASAFNLVADMAEDQLRTANEPGRIRMLGDFFGRACSAAISFAHAASDSNGVLAAFSRLSRLPDLLLQSRPSLAPSRELQCLQEEITITSRLRRIFGEDCGELTSKYNGLVARYTASWRAHHSEGQREQGNLEPAQSAARHVEPGVAELGVIVLGEKAIVISRTAQSFQHRELNWGEAQVRDWSDQFHSSSRKSGSRFLVGGIWGARSGTR